MSILLDALKKSEAQRRLGEIPTLQTNVSADEGHHAGRQNWIPLALILASAGIMSWTGIEQFRQEDPLPASAQRKGAASGVIVTQSGSEEATPASVAAGEPKARPSRTRAQASNAVTTPVKDYVVDDPAPVSEEQAPTNRESVVGANPPSRDAPEAGLDASGRQTENEPSRRLTHVEVEANTSAAAASAAAPASGEPTASDQAAYAPQSISYWQMPQSLREEMGEFRISVLVYSENPADRFLLVNGSRLREQEETDGGVRLETIERDRAVFSYRNYRFHVQN